MTATTFDHETLAGIATAEIQIHRGDVKAAFIAADRKARQLQSGTWAEVAKIILNA